MNPNSFQYSVLKYRHSILLNEILNVGLLFYFPSTKKIQFIFPNKLNRISHLYSNLNIGIIKSVHSIFQNNCNILNKQWKDLDNGLLAGVEQDETFKEIISRYFLVLDASSLYFDEIKTGVNIGIESIISHYNKQYFSCYEDLVIHPLKKDEKYIENRLKLQLKRRIPDLHKIEINKEISVGLISERFKWGWKNGSENLISPIGFDLQESDTIKQKALSWFGKLSFLKEYAIENDINFHILTSRPSNKSLFKAYDNALKVIDKSGAPTRIYEESKIEEYSDYIKNNIKD